MKKSGISRNGQFFPFIEGQKLNSVFNYMLIGAYVTFIMTFSNSAIKAQSIQWEQNYGGSLSDRAQMIRQTDDGGFVVCGYSKSDDQDVPGNYGRDDVLVLKMDNSGNLEWQNHYGGSEGERAYAIRQTPDGGYIFVGRTKSSDQDISNSYRSTDYWVVKINANGDIMWENTFGGDNPERALDVITTNDGNFVIAGSTSSSSKDVSGNNGDEDIWIVKVSNSGNLLWENHYGGSGSDQANAILQTADGGYFVAGLSYSDSSKEVSGNNGASDYWMLKLDNGGQLLWEQNYGGSGNDYGIAAKQTNNGNFIVTGSSESSDKDVSGNNGNFDYWTIRLDASGNLLWEVNHGGSTLEEPKSIIQTTDGFLVAGQALSGDKDVSNNYGAYDFWLVKVNGSGKLQWEENFGGYLADIGNSVIQTNNGGFILAGESNSSTNDVSANYGSGDFWVVKVGNNTNAIRNDFGNDLQVFPNPVEENVTIQRDKAWGKNATATLFNSHGERIKARKLNAGNKATFQVTGNPGYYFMEIKANDGDRAVFKIIKN